MPKTPDDVKKGLECCKEDECFGDRENCPYTADPKLCVGVMCADALALIQQLQAQNAEQAERIRVLETERDAAVRDLTEMAQDTDESCEYCKMFKTPYCSLQCRIKNKGFEWRGVTKEE